MKERINKILEYSKNINLLYVEDNAENRESTSNVLSIIFANIIIFIRMVNFFMAGLFSDESK